jgi:hypothetical protein
MVTRVMVTILMVAETLEGRWNGDKVWGNK